jgi:hypothetical protein
MKWVFIFLLFVTLIEVRAQVPQGFSFQTIIRDAEGKVQKNKSVRLRFSILEGSSTGMTVYSETHTTVTDPFGIINLTIGLGTPVSGNFSDIVWGGKVHFVKTEIDPTGGTNYMVSTTTQLLSVPYAMYASQADTVLKVPDNSDTNELQTINKNGRLVSLSLNGGSFMDSVLTEYEVDSFVSNNGYLSTEEFIDSINNLRGEFLGFSSQSSEIYYPLNFYKQELFQIDTVWIVPDNTFKITIEANGGGGGGGGSGANMGDGKYNSPGKAVRTSGAGGGGAGEYAGIVLNVTPGSFLNISIGKGGAGGSRGNSCQACIVDGTVNGQKGEDGGKTVISYLNLNVIEANGGLGGFGSQASYVDIIGQPGIGGEGGDNSFNKIKIKGGNGENGTIVTGGNPGIGGNGGKGANAVNYSLNLGGNGADGKPGDIYGPTPGNNGLNGGNGYVVISYLF